MANDLITRLLLDSKQFDNNITKATREVQDFQKKTAGISKTVSNSFNSMLGVVGKIAPALGVAVGGYEAFNKVVNSSEGNIDAWGRTCEAAKASVDSFFISLNTGNFSNFLSGLGDVIKSAREAYDAIDDLGTTIAFQDVELSKLETKKLQLEIQIKEGKGGEEELKEVIKQEYAMASERAAKAEASYKASLKSVIQSETGGWYDAEMADYWSTWENFKTLSKADLARENQELEKRKQALGSQYDLVLANYNKYKKMVEAGTASEKVAQSVALVDATREYNIKKAILDQESKIVEAKKYEVVAQKALQSAYQSEKETLRYTADKTEKQAKNAKAITSALSGGNMTFTINGKNIFEDKRIVDAINTMSSQDKAKFNELIRNYDSKTQQLLTLSKQGLISNEDFSKATQSAGKELISGLLSLDNGGILTQNKKMAEEVILPILKSLNMSVSKTPVGQFEAYEKSVNDNIALFDARMKKGNISGSEAASWAEGLQQFQGNIRSFASDYNLQVAKGFSDRVRLEYDYENNEEEKEKLKSYLDLIDEFENGKYTIQEFATLIDGLGNQNYHIELVSEEEIDRLNILANELNPVIEQLQTMAEKMQLLNAIKETLSDVSGLINAAHSFGNEWISAGANILQALIPVINATTALAVAEGAEKGVKTSRNWIEAIAAVTTLVGTIVSVVRAANGKTKYANGGIVQGGSYSGDNNLVRVNAGEMILNGSQQANLFRMLNGEGFNKSTSVAVTGTLKASGKDLIAVIGNTQNKYGKL